MKVAVQVWIDGHVFRPLTYIFNIITRIVGQIARLDHDLTKNFDRIVICKFKGMGSIVQTIPLLSALRERYPDATILFVTTDANKTLLQHIPEVNRIITIKDTNPVFIVLSLVSAWWSLIRFRPQVYLDLELYSYFSSLFTLFSLAKNRIGFYTRGDQSKMGIYTHMMFFNTNVAVSKVYQQLAFLMGGAEKHFPVMLKLPAKSERPSQTYIVINPNASDLRLERRWPAENYRKLIAELAEKYPLFQIKIIGSKDEKDYVDKLWPKNEYPNVENLAGKTTFNGLLQLIAEAKLMITNDTGPMHLAFGLQTPVICLFGPCSPVHYGMEGKNIKTFYQPVYCSPCVHEFLTPPCKGKNVCMQTILYSEVFESAHHFLQNGYFEEKKQHAGDMTYKSTDLTLGVIKRS